MWWKSDTVTTATLLCILVHRSCLKFWTNIVKVRLHWWYNFNLNINPLPTSWYMNCWQFCRQRIRMDFKIFTIACSTSLMHTPPMFYDCIRKSRFLSIESISAGNVLLIWRSVLWGIETIGLRLSVDCWFRGGSSIFRQTQRSFSAHTVCTALDTNIVISAVRAHLRKCWY